MRQPGHAGPGTEVEPPMPDAEDADAHPTYAARRRAAEQQGKDDHLAGELYEDRSREFNRDIERARSAR